MGPTFILGKDLTKVYKQDGHHEFLADLRT